MSTFEVFQKKNFEGKLIEKYLKVFYFAVFLAILAFIHCFNFILGCVMPYYNVSKLFVFGF